MFLLRIMPLLLAVAGVLNAQQPEWIWHTQRAADGEVRYFRKTFTLDDAPAEATLSASCDNQLVVFLNGKQIGESREWQQPVKANVKAALQKGENVLAVRGRNNEGVAALVVRLEAKLAGGKTVTIVSDPSWQSSDRETAGWQTAQFSATGWNKPVSLAKLGAGPWGDVFSGKAGGAKAPPTAELQTAPGFKAELIRTAQAGEGSWVAMAADDKGRLIVSPQNRISPTNGGMLRLTLGADGKVANVEPIETPVGAAMGLLYAFDSLYVNGDGPQGHGLYRLRASGDKFQEAKFLKKLDGSGEHGPHGVVLGPDKQIYVMNGNHTKLPQDLASSSPLKNWAEDHLLPRQWDANGHAVGILAPGGCLFRTDADGAKWEVFCGSFRNAYDFAFNADGECFTYDSDMEWDMGSPWYRPTRIVHCVSGGEYGWRSGTSNEPPYYPDSLPPTLDIGPGSPTGLKFGTEAKGWPAKYQRALYAMDWAYGKIYAVHLQPEQSTYKATAEIFAEGRPLNVTDLEFSNGTMYFITGGRGTQSGLYRVTFTGQAQAEPAAKGSREAEAARTLRRQLEAFHGKQDPKAIETAWPHLDSPDRFLRWAARTAIEWQPTGSWQQRALDEKRPRAAIEALVALAHCAKPELKPRIVEKLASLPVDGMTEDQQLAAIRVTGLVFTRLGQPTDSERQQMLKLWDKQFPAANHPRKATGDLNDLGMPEASFVKDATASGHNPVAGDWNLNRELSQLLVYLDAPKAVDRTMALLANAPGQEEQMHYAFVLRNARNGWSAEQRRAYFGWFEKARTQYKGGASFQKFLVNMKKDAVGTLSAEERTALASVIDPAAPAQPSGVQNQKARGFVKAWTMEELLTAVQNGKGNAARGKQFFTEAQCVLCHRFGQDGGAVGPDLTGSGSRFNRHDLLEAILDPSKVVSDQYRNTVITRKNGSSVTGRLADEQPDKVAVLENPFSTDKTEIPASAIAKRELSPVSPMPPGLLNLFTKEEVIDLLTFLESGGK